MNTGTLLTKAWRSTFSIVSIFAAIGLLFALLLLSTAPEQDTYRALDAKLRYVQDVTVALGQTLNTAQRRDLDVGPELTALADSFEKVSQSTQQDVQTIYSPDGPLLTARELLTQGFNAVGKRQDVGANRLSDQQVVALGNALKSQVAELVQGTNDFARYQGELVRTTKSLTEQSRSLVRDLRERGKDRDHQHQHWRVVHEHRQNQGDDEGKQQTQLQVKAE